MIELSPNELKRIEVLAMQIAEASMDLTAARRELATQFSQVPGGMVTFFTCCVFLRAAILGAPADGATDTFETLVRFESELERLQTSIADAIAGRQTEFEIWKISKSEEKHYAISRKREVVKRESPDGEAR